MEVVHECCCGIDVHQGVLVGTVLKGGLNRPTKQVRSFGTMTEDLQALEAWLKGHGVTAVAMEGTGVYWMPLYEVLEETFDVTVANAQHIKKVPGRKTDVSDSAWIADLLRHGLLRKSFIPPKPIRALRFVTRYRSKLVQARTADRNRLTKQLESMNIKLASVASSVFGVSGMLMLDAIAAGGASAAAIADLAKGTLRNKKDDLAKAVTAAAAPEQLFTLKIQLDRLRENEKQIARIEEQIQRMVQPYQREIDLLTTIPGVDFTVATTVIAELGPSFAAFPSADALCAWAGICPGSNESAGKRKSTRIRAGNHYLKPMLVEAAHCASRAKNGGYLRSKYWRCTSRMDKKSAAVVVAHKILNAMYHVLTRQEPYRDLGANYLDKQHEERTLRAITKRAERMGYQVILKPTGSEPSVAARPATQAAANRELVGAQAPTTTSPVPRVRTVKLNPNLTYHRANPTVTTSPKSASAIPAAAPAAPATRSAQRAASPETAPRTSVTAHPRKTTTRATVAATPTSSSAIPVAALAAPATRSPQRAASSEIAPRTSVVSHSRKKTTPPTLSRAAPQPKRPRRGEGSPQSKRTRR